MQTIWAPWREDYISNLSVKKKVCVFCQILKNNNDKQNMVLIRKPNVWAVLNLYPYSNAHCLVLPTRHVADISKLTQEEFVATMGLVREIKDVLQKEFKPQGFNIGMNLGRLAGAGIPGHLHVHIVPRWKGDHNFMPVTAATKVISQSLPVTYKRIHDAFKERYRGARK